MSGAPGTSQRGRVPGARLEYRAMFRRPPEFYVALQRAVRVLLAANPGHTGRVVITLHCKDGEAMTVAVDAPEVPKRWDELTS